MPDPVIPSKSPALDYIEQINKQTAQQPQQKVREVTPEEHQKLEDAFDADQERQANAPGVIGTIKDVGMQSAEGVSDAIISTEKFVQWATGSGAPKPSAEQIAAGDVGSGNNLPGDGAKTKLGGLAHGISQFTTEFIGLGKLARIGKGVSWLVRAGQTGGAGAVGFDPYESRLSNLIEEHPVLRNPITEALASDKNDPKSLAYLKSFLENAGLGAAADGVVNAVGLLRQGRAVKAAKGDEAAAEFMAEHADELEPKAAPEPSQFQDTSPANQPEHTLTDLTSDQLDELAAKQKAFTRDTENRILGDKADAWRKASNPDPISDAVGAKFGTKAWDELYRVTDHKELSDLAKKVRAVENGSPEDIGTMLGNRIYDVVKAAETDPASWTPRQVESVAIFKAAQRAAASNGLSAGEINSQIAKAAERYGHKPADIADLFKSAKPLDSNPKLEASTAQDASAVTASEEVKTASTGTASAKSEGLGLQNPNEPAQPANLQLTPEQLQAVHDNFVAAIKEGKPITSLTGLNIDHLLLPDAPLQLMEAVSKTLMEPIEKLKANGQTLESIFQNADALGADPIAIMAKGRLQAKQAAKWAADQTAMRMLNATYSNAAGELGLLNEAKIAAGTHTPADDIKLLAMLSRQAQIQADTEAIVSGHARATSANRIDVIGSNNIADQVDALTPKVDPLAPATKTPEEILKHILSQPDGSFRLRQLSKVVAGLKDNPKGMTMVARALNNGLEITNNLWMNAILSRPVSFVRDQIGNTINTFVPPIEKMIGGIRRLDEKAVMEGARTLYYLGESSLESLKMAKLAWDNGVSFIDPAVQFTAAEKVALSAVPGESLFSNGVRFLGLVAELPTRLRITADEFWKQTNARAFIRARASQMAIDEGVPKSQIKAYIESKLDQAISAENGKSLSQSATDYSRYATFQQPLDPESIIGKYEQLVNEHPIMRQVTPFVRTPTNLYKWVWHRSPGLNALSREFRDAWNAGGTQRAEMEGRMATGALLWTSAIYLAHKGVSSGAGPSDPEQNKMWKAAGNQPYSVTLSNGTKVSYSSIDPIATFFGLAADYHENSGQWTDEGRTSVADAMRLAMVKSVTSKSMLQGIAQVVDLVTDKNTDDKAWERFMRSRVSSFVPAGVRDITQMLPHDSSLHTENPYLKEVQSVMDAVIAKTPFSSYVADYRNMFGERVLIPPGLGEATMSPFAVTKDEGDELSKELAKYPNGFNRPSPQLSENVRLNSKQYSERLALLAEAPEGFDKNLREELTDVINSQEYKEASDNYSTRFGGISERKMLLVHRIQAYYKATEQEFIEQKGKEAIKAAIEADRNAKNTVKQEGISAAPENPLELLNKFAPK